MADEEDFDVADKHVITKSRPERLIEIREHDVGKAKCDEIVELAQSILDALPDEAIVSHKDIAIFLKRKLEETYSGTWHAIVGNHFGGNVTNDDDTLVNFRINGKYYLVFRSGPPDRPLTTDAAEGSGVLKS